MRDPVWYLSVLVGAVCGGVVGLPITLVLFLLVGETVAYFVLAGVNGLMGALRAYWYGNVFEPDRGVGPDVLGGGARRPGFGGFDGGRASGERGGVERSEAGHGRARRFVGYGGAAGARRSRSYRGNNCPGRFYRRFLIRDG